MKISLFGFEGEIKLQYIFTFIISAILLTIATIAIISLKMLLLGEPFENILTAPTEIATRFGVILSPLTFLLSYYLTNKQVRKHKEFISDFAYSIVIFQFILTTLLIMSGTLLGFRYELVNMLMMFFEDIYAGIHAAVWFFVARCFELGKGSELPYMHAIGLGVARFAVYILFVYISYVQAGEIFTYLPIPADIGSILMGAAITFPFLTYVKLGNVKRKEASLFIIVLLSLGILETLYSSENMPFLKPLVLDLANLGLLGITSYLINPQIIRSLTEKK